MNIYGISNIGTVRKENQDCFGIHESDNYVLAVVCDGMGGASAGMLAAQITCNHFLNRASMCLDIGTDPVAKCLNDAASSANRIVFERQLVDVNCQGMGATLVGMHADDSGVTLINVGDSSAYRVSDHSIRKITHDHSFVQQLIDNGTITEEEAKVHPNKSEITRVIGGEAFVNSDIFQSDAKKGDYFLLFSDGLTNVLRPEQILNYIEQCSDVKMICGVLMNTALELGARDNVTIVCLEYDGKGDAGL